MNHSNGNNKDIDFLYLRDRNPFNIDSVTVQRILKIQKEKDVKYQCELSGNIDYTQIVNIYQQKTCPGKLENIGDWWIAPSKEHLIPRENACAMPVGE